MSTEYLMSSKVMDKGVNGRTIPFFWLWACSVSASDRAHNKFIFTDKVVQMIVKNKHYLSVRLPSAIILPFEDNFDSTFSPVTLACFSFNAASDITPCDFPKAASA